MKKNIITKFSLIIILTGLFCFQMNILSSNKKKYKPVKVTFARQMFGDRIVDGGLFIYKNKTTLGFAGGLTIFSGLIKIPFIPKKIQDKFFKVGVISWVLYSVFGNSKIDRIDKTTIDTNERVKKLQSGQSEMKKTMKKQETLLSIIDGRTGNIQLSLDSLKDAFGLDFKNLKEGQTAIALSQEEMLKRQKSLDNKFNVVEGKVDGISGNVAIIIEGIGDIKKANTTLLTGQEELLNKVNKVDFFQGKFFGSYNNIDYEQALEQYNPTGDVEGI